MFCTLFIGVLTTLPDSHRVHCALLERERHRWIPAGLDWNAVLHNLGMNSVGTHT